MTTTITPRSIPEVEDDIRRYTERLSINCVKANMHWVAETKAKIAAARAELVAAKLAARARRDQAASLAAVQHLAPRVGAGAGAR